VGGYTGIDRIAAIRLFDVNGLDSGFPPPFHEASGGSRGIRGGAVALSYDNRQYSADWLHMAVILTLMRSIAPHKLVLDSEWHLLTECVRCHAICSFPPSPPPLSLCHAPSLSLAVSAYVASNE
jgi:hypothetical protein